MPHSECFVDGVWMPSVTTIIGAQPKPWLQAWREKWGVLANRKTVIAGFIGDEFHRCVEQWLDTGTFTAGHKAAPEFPRSCTRRVEGMMGSFVRWAQEVDGTVAATELKVVSRAHTYSGTLDAVGTLGKKPVIYDWKTSSRIYPDYELQLAAYAQAYNEIPWTPPYYVGVVKDGIIVHVSKDKPRFKVTVKSFKLGKRVFRQFLKLRSMFDDMQANLNREGTSYE